MARTGRRPGESTTRAAILAVARDAFSAQGYDAVTVRRIAAAAGVDPALVHYHFGTKERLFRAVVHDAITPQDLLAQSLAGDVEMLGERLVMRFLDLWEQGGGTVAGTLLRTAVTGEAGARLAREVVFPAVVQAMTRRAGVRATHLPLRAALIAAQLSGLVIARYVLELEPLAQVPNEVVAAAVGPAVQRYLTGDLPGAGQGPEPSAH